MEENWRDVRSGKFNIHAFESESYDAKIWVKKPRKFRKQPKIKPKISLEESANKWIEIMTNKYGWKNFKVITDGVGRIDGSDAYWQIYSFERRGVPIKEKIYRVLNKNYGYQFRLSSIRDDFDASLKEFETWIKTIKFINTE